LSALRVVHCTGAPRDLGFDQGLAGQEPIQAEAARVRPNAWLPRIAFELAPSGRADRVRRDVARYFPHMSERAGGLAQAARVGTASVAALLARSFETHGGACVAAEPERTRGGALLGRAVTLQGGDPGAALWVRHSAPEGAYRSVEVVLAWGVPALLGVNEHGLAVTAAMEPSPAESLSRCAAPAQLLAQDCLQRFDALDKAVEWIERRPAGGRCSLLLADGSGRTVLMTVDGETRRLGAGEAGLCCAGAPAAERLALEKVCASEPRLDPGSLVGALEAVQPAAVAHLVADPLGRRIGVAAPGGDLRWTEVELG
jgi:hypothetical protein